MSSPLSLVCALCGAPSTESSGVVQPCANGCGRQTEAVPYEPAMSHEERARRAEMLAERLACDLENAIQYVPRPMLRHYFREAATAWAAHRARLDRQGVPR